MVVAAHVTELVVLALLALRDAAGHVEAVFQDVAAQAAEVGGADTAVERRLGGVLARAPVVAGARVAEAVGGVLTLGPGE